MNIATAVEKSRSPALRLVSTKDLSRNDWLNVRKGGIGSSDAAAAVGLNPYQSQLELWMIKTSRDAKLPKVDPNDETSPMYWGSLLEPIVAAHYTKRTGNKVRRINSVLQHPDSDRRWMLANLDYVIVNGGDAQILECKTAGEFGARLWKDGVPEYVQLQVQHQLAVTNKIAADVCVLICGQEIRVHRIERDDALINRLIELEQKFWMYVETDTPPPADGSESAATALKCLYPSDSGNTLDFVGDTEMSSTFSDLVAIRADIEAREKLEAELKQRIQQRMGDASRAKFGTGTVSWKRSKDGLILDVIALMKDQPALLSTYPLIRAGTRRFLINT
ncbi:YqaJ viral recombinase family nuclease [Massilia aquatica]|uniref:YqaJ viral recombinase family protein n=1 Tax=Massilia aquatica TaxID=2609000 RepID=A0ABX0M0F0_9BURK|nr:YqaJ viral recombinase family protein [Massilia aquatica]NHZ38575.1 YqaJ viral recombinase family protein [Massilia aquatica]